eukprot:TCALIF_03690-PA protein Name:"Similar to Egfr Epidermal growth factor receptor (Drosophila melanogaster)" AED:0.16 eAED:0.16 QI:552/0.71/0.75/1/0.71/0.75/8/642/992
MAPLKFVMTSHHIILVILSLAWLTLGTKAVRAEQVHKAASDKHHRHGKICIGTSGRMSVPNNREHHYRNLRDRYTNCTYVDGNLELTWLQDENLDLSFLQHIREVTGYVLISHVDVTRIVLPSLQIIRGRTLFKLSVQEDEFALIVTLSKMHNLELPALRDILDGSVGIMNNYNLCHIKTIEWKEIITGQNAKYLYVYKFAEPERDCTPCHESCQAGCWGEGPHNCQKFSKINCSPQCHGGRCFGPKPRECCHLFCAGGCTGPKQSDCLACRNFYDDGVCKQECPPMQRYNPIKYKWERNPDGKYAYGATCVKDCPKHLLKDNGACVRACPPKKKNENGECVPCEGPCPKTCHFSDTIHAGNINLLQNCTVIEGSLTILDSSFHGFQQIYDNFTFGPRYPALDPAKLDVLSTLREVTGYLNIQAHHPNFKNLDAFRNLEIVGGRTLTEYFSSLYVVKTSLTSLNLKSLRKIRSGSVAILENQDLCFASKIKWQKIMKSPSHNTLLQNNKDPQMCITQGFDCDRQCSAEGCWGPGNKLCLSCKNYQVEDECVASLEGKLQSLSGKAICRPCHPLCKRCNGYGFHQDVCHECYAFEQDEQCVTECSSDYFADQQNKKCKPCANECRGCYGPSVAQCHSCKNYKLFPEGADPHDNTTAFSCTKTCPDETPHKIFTDQEDDNASSMPNGYPSANTLHSQKSLSHQGMNTASRRGMAAAAGLRLELPVDEEDYLVPSPQSPAANSAQGPNNHTPTLNNNVNAYMDLLSGGSAENGNGKSASNPSNSTNTNTSNSNTMFPYPPPQGYFLTDNPSNYGRVPDFTPFANTGLVSMDNPEYILNEHRNKSNRGNYHTLGIPLVNGGSPGPSSIQSAPGGNGNNPPYTSLPGGNPRNGYSSVPPGTTSGLNGVINGMAPGVPRTPGVSSHPRSSAGEESDEHEYYNDFDRLKREMQPLHPNRTSTASSSNGSVVTANLANGPPGMLSLNPASSNINKHETTV